MRSRCRRMSPRNPVKPLLYMQRRMQAMGKAQSAGIPPSRTVGRLPGSYPHTEETVWTLHRHRPCVGTTAGAVIW